MQYLQYNFSDINNRLARCREYNRIRREATTDEHTSTKRAAAGNCGLPEENKIGIDAKLNLMNR